MNAETLARSLNAVRSGRQWKCQCVAHEDREPSMIIFDGITAVQVRCLAGCDTADVIDALKRRGLWGGDVTSRHMLRHDVTPHPRANKNSVSRETMVRALFERSTSCVDTVAQTYFMRREIWSVAQGIDDIRFCASCPRGDERVPAIVVAMRSFTSREIVAVQRIYITRSGVKDGKPMMLGAASGSAMQLQPRSAVLNVCEGLETALSLIAMDERPVWALGSTSLITSFPIIDGVDRLALWADHDDPGIKAALQCRDNWRAAGRAVRVLQPDNEGDDAADVWRIRLARL